LALLERQLERPLVGMGVEQQAGKAIRRFQAWLVSQSQERGRYLEAQQANRQIQVVGTVVGSQVGNLEVASPYPSEVGTAFREGGSCHDRVCKGQVPLDNTLPKGCSAYPGMPGGGNPIPGGGGPLFPDRSALLESVKNATLTVKGV
jgi:hypothetical protein